MKLIFEKVGRAKKMFAIEIAGAWDPRVLDHEKVAKAVRKHGSLMSRDIGFTFDDKTKTGTVLAGFHSVGSFRAE